MKFKVGDVVEIDPIAPINSRGHGNKKLAERLSGRSWVVAGVIAGDNLTLEDDANGYRSGYISERFRLAQPKTNPFSWSGGIPQDPDLHRGYCEECSEYRACTNEHGEWVIEATRRKTIALCSDEAEARRIADALNTTINN